MELAALKSELESDPAGMGYAKHLAIGSDGAIADMLNAPGVGVVLRGQIAKGEFLTALAPLLLALPKADADMQTKWDRILAAWNAIDGPIPVGMPSTQLLLQSAVDDGLLTSEQATIGQYAGSRAEVLFGSGVVVHHLDVAECYRFERETVALAKDIERCEAKVNDASNRLQALLPGKERDALQEELAVRTKNHRDAEIAAAKYAEARK